MTNRLIVWGAGELGGNVAGQWVATGRKAVGLTRTESRHHTLQQMGIEPYIDDGEISIPSLLEAGDSLLLALPGHATQRQAIERLAQVPFDTLQLRRAVLVSSTGYYGVKTGTVNEEMPPGNNERSQAIAATEQSFLDWAGSAGVIVRFGGLYRPGRGPFPALKRRGHPIQRPPDTTLALIHYEDAATTIFSALQRSAVESIYLAVTTPCPTRQEFYEAACAKLGLDPPLFATPTGQPLAEYDLSRLRRDLLPVPCYPDWHEALQ